MGEVRGGCNVFACPCSVQAPIRLKYGRNKEAAMPGAAEGGRLFCQNDECWGSPRKMLSHADRAFHFTQRNATCCKHLNLAFVLLHKIESNIFVRFQELSTSLWKTILSKPMISTLEMQFQHFQDRNILDKGINTFCTVNTFPAQLTLHLGWRNLRS